MVAVLELYNIGCIIVLISVLKCRKVFNRVTLGVLRGLSEDAKNIFSNILGVTSEISDTLPSYTQKRDTVARSGAKMATLSAICCETSEKLCIEWQIVYINLLCTIPVNRGGYNSIHIKICESHITAHPVMTGASVNNIIQTL